MDVMAGCSTSPAGVCTESVNEGSVFADDRMPFMNMLDLACAYSSVTARWIPDTCSGGNAHYIYKPKGFKSGLVAPFRYVSGWKRLGSNENGRKF
jgi:hypothetical protein